MSIGRVSLHMNSLTLSLTGFFYGRWFIGRGKIIPLVYNRTRSDILKFWTNIKKFMYKNHLKFLLTSSKVDKFYSYFQNRFGKSTKDINFQFCCNILNGN